METDPRPYTMGIWTVKPGKEEEFLEAWQGFAKWTKDHVSGVETVMMLRGVEDPRRFISFGPWKDEQIIAFWRGLPEFKAFFVHAKELCEDIRPMTLKTILTL